MSLCKKLTCKGTLRLVFYLSEDLPPPPYNPHSPPLTHNILIHTEKRERGGRANQRVGLRGNSSQSWVENTNMTDCISSL
jgi:hypothetical protein